MSKLKFTINILMMVINCLWSCLCNVGKVCLVLMEGTVRLNGLEGKQEMSAEVSHNSSKYNLSVIKARHLYVKMSVA